MQAISRDSRSAYSPFAEVLPRKPLGDVTDLSFSRSECGEGRRTSLIPVSGHIVLRYLQHKRSLSSPRRTHVTNRTQHIVSVLLGILHPGLLNLNCRNTLHLLEHQIRIECTNRVNFFDFVFDRVEPHAFCQRECIYRVVGMYLLALFRNHIQEYDIHICGRLLFVQQEGVRI